jgi:hypothetical protein
MKYKSLTLASALLLASGWAAAHHSVAAVFSNEVIELTGVISDMDWINPHTHVYLDVTEDDGSVITWELESSPTAMLRRGGLTKAMIIGDGQPVTVRAQPARPETGTPHRAYIKRITYADGHYYQLSAED